MVMRDKIIEEIQEYELDNQGGRVSKGEPIRRQILCRASLNTSPEIATAYGTNGEQVLYVITSQALAKEVRYFFNEVPFTVRKALPTSRFTQYILIEVKE